MREQLYINTTPPPEEIYFIPLYCILIIEMMQLSQKEHKKKSFIDFIRGVWITCAIISDSAIIFPPLWFSHTFISRKRWSKWSETLSLVFLVAFVQNLYTSSTVPYIISRDKWVLKHNGSNVINGNTKSLQKKFNKNISSPSIRNIEIYFLNQNLQN